MFHITFSSCDTFKGKTFKHLQYLFTKNICRPNSHDFNLTLYATTNYIEDINMYVLDHRPSFAWKL